MRYFGHRASLSKVKYAWTCEHDQRMLVSSYNNAMHGNTIFIWRISIPGKLDDFCLAYVLFPLISPAFIYNVIIRLIKYLTHVKGMLHKIKQQIVRGRLCPVKRVLNAYNTDILYIYTIFCFMFKQCFIGLGLKGAHSSNYSKILVKIQCYSKPILHLSLHHSAVRTQTWASLQPLQPHQYPEAPRHLEILLVSSWHQSSGLPTRFFLVVTALLAWSPWETFGACHWDQLIRQYRKGSKLHCSTI